MPDDLIPPAALQAAADAIAMQIVADAHYELHTDPHADLARAALEAALPQMWVAWQQKAPPLAWQQTATGVQPYDPDTAPAIDLPPEEAEQFAETLRSLRGDDQLPFVLRLLKVLSEADCTDDLWWIQDGPKLRFLIMCNDQFDWATADAVQVTADNIAELEQAFTDVLAITGGDAYDGPLLFCARQRGVRPQGACYPADRRLWPLFDAAGPPRETDIMNPYRPGGRRSQAVSDARRLRLARAEATRVLDIVRSHEDRGGLAGATPALRTGLDRIGALLGARGVSPEAAKHAAETLGTASADEGS